MFPFVRFSDAIIKRFATSRMAEFEKRQASFLNATRYRKRGQLSINWTKKNDWIDDIDLTIDNFLMIMYIQCVYNRYIL